MSSHPNNTALRLRLERLERDWLKLVTQLPDSEGRLHSTRMQLLPSRQALNELLLWLRNTEETLREDANKRLTSALDIQALTKKYQVGNSVQ